MGIHTFLTGDLNTKTPILIVCKPANGENGRYWRCFLLAISGNSPKALRAVEYANSTGCKTIGLTTSTGGRLKEIAQLPLLVATDHMGRLEDSFFVMTHILSYAFIEGIADVSRN